MSEREDLVHNYVTAAQRDLPPLLNEAAEALDLTVAQAIELGRFLSMTWTLGAQAGQAEMMAQAIESGIDVKPRFASELDENEEAD